MYRKSTFEERLEIVLKIKSGYPLKSLCKELNLDRDFVRDWLQKYDENGESGLRHKVIKDVDGAEKEHFVRLFLEESVPLRQIYISNGISRSALKRWICKVREHGYSSLYEHVPKGRKPKKMGRPKKKKPQTELEILQAENLRLRAENALLKKVRALMEEEESRLQGTGLKPSSH